MNRNLERSAYLATIGGAILAVIALQEWFPKIWNVPQYYRWGAYAGLVLIAGSLLCIVLWWFERVRELTGDLSVAPYFVSQVTEPELNDFHAFCKSILGDGVATLDRLKQWHAKNPRILYLVVSEDHKRLRRKRRPVGFFSIFPVTKEASAALALNHLKGTELGPQYIVSEGHKAAALYIGGVGAKGFRAKQQTLGALVGQVMLLGQRTPLIYTRPITEVGRRRAVEYEFRPVIVDGGSSEDMVYVRKL